MVLVPGCLTWEPSKFPDGEMITRLFPLLVANPLCVDMDGAPISYESYEFSPRQVCIQYTAVVGVPLTETQVNSSLKMKCEVTVLPHP